MRSEFQNVQTLILAGSLEQAQRELKSIDLKSEIDHRVFGHLFGVIALRKGQLEEAKICLEETLAKYGENVKLLRDLACCYLENHDMQSFREMQKRLEKTLEQKWANLTFSSRFNVQLTVAKFCEEDGRVAQALHKYRLLLDLTERPQAKGQRELVLAQLVRAQALYQPSHHLYAYYSELITMAAPEHTFEVNIEVEHSLMLAELVLVGPEHAWIRVQQMLGRAEILPADRRLLYFDFIEGCLSYGLTIPVAAKEILSTFSDLDLYEQQILIMAKWGGQEVDLPSVNQLASKMSWSSYVRLLCILAQQEELESKRLEVQRKVLFLVGSLDEESKDLWRKKLKENFNNQETRLEFSSHKRKLYFAGQSFDLTRKKSMIQLVEALMVVPVLSIDEAIQKLWGANFSPEHYHRLRMIVHRLNRLIHEGASLGKVIEVDSQSVRLKPGFRITDYELSRDQMRSARL